MKKKTIVILQGSLKTDSSNQQLVEWIRLNTTDLLDWNLSLPLDQLPYFNPDLDGADTGKDIPTNVLQLRSQLAQADGILVVSPEYVFSLPGVLKNALEWLVSTTTLTDKPTGLLIAAASGEKAQEQLTLLLSTLGAKFEPETMLLIKGIKGKILAGEIGDPTLAQELKRFSQALYELVSSTE